MRRKRGIFLVLVVTLLLAGGLLALYAAACHVPAFYRQRIDADPAAQKKAHDKMFRQVTVLGNGMRKEGSWQAEFSDQDINGWLAFDLSKNFPHALPAQLHDPRVMIQPEGITIACRADNGRLRTVLTLTIEVYLQEPRVIALRICKVRVGALPWPMKRVLQSIADAARRLGLLIQWRQADGDPVALITISMPKTKHDKVVEIETLRLGDGVLKIAGTTRRP